MPVAVVSSPDGQPTEVVDGAVQGGKAAGRYGGRVIVEIEEEWKVHDEWWRTPIHRRYFGVVLEGGAHMVLFEDVTTGKWYLQTP